MFMIIYGIWYIFPATAPRRRISPWWRWASQRPCCSLAEHPKKTKPELSLFKSKIFIIYIYTVYVYIYSVYIYIYNSVLVDVVSVFFTEIYLGSVYR